jgi:hypothetical protein
VLSLDLFSVGMKFHKKNWMAVKHRWALHFQQISFEIPSLSGFLHRPPFSPKRGQWLSSSVLTYHVGVASLGLLLFNLVFHSGTWSTALLRPSSVQLAQACCYRCLEVKQTVQLFFVYVTKCTVCSVQQHV